MNSEEDRQLDKITYEKPTAVDLGPAAPIVGGSCAPGDQFAANGACAGVGNHAYVDCGSGNNATVDCLFGLHPSAQCGDGGGLV